MMFTLSAGNNCILCHVFCWLWLYSWHFLRNVLFWCFTIVNLLFCTCNCVCLLFLILLFYIAKLVSLCQIQEFFRLILTLWLSMNSGRNIYSHTCIKRSWPLVQRHSGLIRQVTSFKKQVQFIWNVLWQDKKRWPFNTGDCLIEVTTWADFNEIRLLSNIHVSPSVYIANVITQDTKRAHLKNHTITERHL